MMPPKGRAICHALQVRRDDSHQDRMDKGEACTDLQGLVRRFTSSNPVFGYTYEVGMRVITFTCSHPGQHKFQLGITLKDWRDTDGWADAIQTVIATHRRKCPETR